MMTPQKYEKVIMAHRYLYYVLSDTAISDSIYDRLEQSARDVLPPESPVHGVGSSLASSYTPEIVAYAHEILFRSC